MEKIIIFGYTLEIGGAEKVLIDILKQLSNHYEIDLILYRKKGNLLNELPDSVKVYEIKTNLLHYACFRFLPFYRAKVVNQFASRKPYNYAVAFMEGRAATLVADIKGSLKRLAWIHNDVNQFDIGISEQEIKKSYQAMDQIICVSRDAAKAFIEKYEINPSIVKVIYNMIDEKTILAKSKEITLNNPCFTFVNVAKLRKQKRHDRLIRVASKLKKAGYQFQIQIVGDGPEQETLQKLVSEEQVEDCVFLLGLKQNPYPYIRCADCFVLCSDFEGYGIVIKEALLLQTPIISTDVVGPREILQEGRFGLIVETSDEMLYNGMESVLKDAQILEHYRKNMEAYEGDNEVILNQIMELFHI